MGFHFQACMKKWYHLLSELSWVPVFSGCFLSSLSLLLVNGCTLRRFRETEPVFIFGLKAWDEAYVDSITSYSILCLALKEELKLQRLCLWPSLHLGPLYSHFDVPLRTATYQKAVPLSTI